MTAFLHYPVLVTPTDVRPFMGVKRTCLRAAYSPVFEPDPNHVR